MIRARFNRLDNKTGWLVLCGKPDARGNRTCPVIFGIAMGGGWGGSGSPLMRMYGIFRPDNHGVYRLSRRHMEAAAKRGWAPTLRRTRVNDQGAWREYGAQGEHAGEVIRDFPIRAICWRCQTENEIVPPKEEIAPTP